MSEFNSSSQSPAQSRRGFLTKSAAVGALALPALMIHGGATESFAATSGRSASDVFTSIRKHENAHVKFLEAALGSLKRPKPTFRNLEQRRYQDFIRVSQDLENTGVGAYLGAAPSLEDRGYLAAAGSIALIEGRHAGFLNVFQDDPISQGDEDFESPLTPEEVVAAAGPFVANLNGGPPLDYEPGVLSFENDIAILNFALALEYLEADFYNINVPKFFPRGRR